MRRINARSRPKWLRWLALVVACMTLSYFYVARMQLLGQSLPRRHQPAPMLPPSTDSVRPPDAATTPPEGTTKSEADVHLLVLWHGSISKREVILEHIASHFVVLDIRAFDWSSAEGALPRTPLRSSTERAALLHTLTHYDDKNTTAMLNDYFLMNLWRLYSGKGGGRKTGMPLKVRQCGRGPFIGIVVVDEHPQYRNENTAHGTDYVNHNMNEAKRLYRKWSGGGYRVHGTFNPTEAAHDITLLFHKHPDAYANEYQQQWRPNAISKSKALVAQFQEAIAWPFETRDASADAVARFVGPEGTLGVHRDTFLYGGTPPTSPVWSSCVALLDVLLAPWPSVEQRRLRTEGFYAWDTTANYPSLPLKVEDCTSWPSEWAVVVREPVWWATAALLNGQLLAGAHSDPRATEGKPERVAVTVRGVPTQYVHIQSLLSEEELPN